MYRKNYFLRNVQLYTFYWPTIKNRTSKLLWDDYIHTEL